MTKCFVKTLQWIERDWEELGRDVGGTSWQIQSRKIETKAFVLLYNLWRNTSCQYENIVCRNIVIINKDSKKS